MNALNLCENQGAIHRLRRMEYLINLHESVWILVF
jgi:hypothetical protein